MKKKLSYESYREIWESELLQRYIDTFCIKPNFEEFMLMCYDEYKRGKTKQ